MSLADDILKDLHDGIAKTLDDLRRELSNVRTGRANLHLLDGVRVDYYGTATPLNQVAKVTLLDARTIGVTPFDKKMIQAVDSSLYRQRLS